MKKIEEKRVLIEEFFEYYSKLNDHHKEIEKTIGCDIESPFWNNIFMGIDNYINLLEHVCGCEDGWISWYVFDNNMGEGNLLVKINGIERNISSLDDLMWIVSECQVEV